MKKKLERGLVLAIFATLLLGFVFTGFYYVCFAIAVVTAVMEILPERLFGSTAKTASPTSYTAFSGWAFERTFG